MRLKEVRGRQKQSLVSALVILLLLALFPGADFDKVKDKKTDDLPEGVVKVQGKTPIVATSSEGSHAQVKRKPSPLSQTQQVELSPSAVDFSDQAVGVPKTRKVLVTNNSSKTIQITSVSGNSLSFHPAPPSKKVINPGEKASFEVIFLPRELGPVAGTLNIYTSLGTVYQEVQGSGTPNPYRLYPLTGSKIPVNGTYAPIITMYNPHPTPLQVTEMYSSGGGINLELVNGQSEGTQSLWVIRPFETKPIMRLSFIGRVASTHSGFIRVKTNSTTDVILIIPVFVEVTKLQGVYIQRDHNIDFGIVKFGDAQKRMPLTLINTYKWDMEITDIYTEPVDDVISFLRVASTLPSQGQRGTKVATVIFNADRLNYEGFRVGKVIVKAKDSDSVKKVKVVATYRVIAMMGSLVSPNTTISFRVGKPPFRTVSKNITFNNRFLSPIVIYDVKLPMRKDVTDHFTVRITEKPYIIHPNSGNHSIVTVRFTPSSSDCMVASDVRIYSNSSSFSVPLYCYDGSLEYKVVSEDDLMDSLEFGVVGEADTVKRAFRVLNRNPIKITIVDVKFKDLHELHVELVGYRPISTCNSRLKVDRSGHTCNETDYSDVQNVSSQAKVTLEKDYEAVFEVTVSEPKMEGKFNGEIIMTTSLAKELHVPVNLKVLLGNLELHPSKIAFASHPFSRQSEKLRAVSHFHYPIRISSVATPPGDQRFIYKCTTRNKSPILEPGSSTQLGVLTFDPVPSRHQSMYSYLGIYREILSLEEWVGLLTQIVGNYNVSMADTRSYKVLRDRWKKLVDSGQKRFEGELVLETNGSTIHRIPLEAEYHWPEVSTVTHLKFSPTLITESSVKTITVQNPSDVPLVIQVVTLNYYPSVLQLLPLMSDRFSTTLIKQLRQNSVLSGFSLPEAPVESEQVPETSTIGSGFTVTHILPPNSTLPVSVKFSPTSPEPYLSMLLVRNNLTVVDPVLLEGEGITPQLFVEGRESGTTSPILFEYTEKMLSKCESTKNPSTSSVQLMQTLTFNNSGPAVIVVKSLSIDGFSCGAYGYLIHHCDREIKIQPNSSAKVEIKHIPDFTLSKITADLHVHISDTTILTYPLLTTLPHHMLAACYTVMPRPVWERWISRGLFVFMLLVLVLVVLLAVRNANLLSREVNLGSLDDGSVKTVGSRNQGKGPLSSEPVLDIRTAKSAQEYNNASTSDHSQDSDRTSSHHITSSVSINVPSSLGKVAHSAILRSTHSSSLEDSTDTRTSAHTHTQTSEEGTNSRKTSDSTIEGKIPRPLSHGPSTIPSSTVASSNAGTPSGMNTLSSRSKGTSGDTLSDVGNSSSSGYMRGLRESAKLTENDKSTSSSFSGGVDREKLQQTKRIKQTSGRKQQTKQIQAKSHVQMSSVKSATLKGDIITTSRQATDSTSSVDSDVGVKKKADSEDKTKTESSSKEKTSTAKETSTQASVDEVKASDSSPVAQPATSKKEQQLSRKDRKKKVKGGTTVVSESLAKRSLSPGKTEEKSRMDDVPRTARSSLESLTESTISNDMEEEGEPVQHTEQKRLEASFPDPSPPKMDAKSKKADILDDISLDSPVVARKGPTAAGKGVVRVKITETQKQEASRNDPPLRKADKLSTASKKALGKKQSKSSVETASKPPPSLPSSVSSDAVSSGVQENQLPAAPQEPDTFQKDTVPDSEEVTVSSGGTKVFLTPSSSAPQPSSTRERVKAEEGKVDKELHEERKLTSPHELAAQLLRKRDNSKKLEQPVEEMKDDSPKLSTEEEPKVSEDQEKRSAVSSPTKSGSGRPSHPYSAHLTSKGGKPLTASKTPVAEQPVVKGSVDSDSVVTRGPVPTSTSTFFPQSSMEPVLPPTTGITTSILTSTTPTSNPQSRYAFTKATKSLGDYLPAHVINSSRTVPASEALHESPVKHLPPSAVVYGKPARKTSAPQPPITPAQEVPHTTYAPEFTKYGTAAAMVPPTDYVMGDSLVSPTSVMSHVQSADHHMMSHAPGTVPHHINYTSAVRKRPGHLDIPAHLAQAGNTTWLDRQSHPARGYPVSSEQVRYYQHHHSQQQHAAYSMYGQTPSRLATRYPNQPEYTTPQSSAIGSPLELLNQLARQPYQPKPVQPQHSVVSCEDIGGEYLPLSSRLTTPTSTAAPTHLNLAPGTTSLIGDHGSHPPNVGQPTSEKSSSFPTMWDSPPSQEDNTKPYGLFGSSSIWGPVTNTSTSAPWMNALASPTSTPSSLDGDKKGKFLENSPFE